MRRMRLDWAAKQRGLGLGRILLRPTLVQGRFLTGFLLREEIRSIGGGKVKEMGEGGKGGHGPLANR